MAGPGSGCTNSTGGDRPLALGWHLRSRGFCTWGSAEALQVAVEHWRAPQTTLGWLLRTQSRGDVLKCVLCVVADKTQGSLELFKADLRRGWRSSLVGPKV